MERIKKFKKFGDRTSKGNEKKKKIKRIKKVRGCCSFAALMYEPPLVGTIPVLTPCPGVLTGRSKCPGYSDHNSSDIYMGHRLKKNIRFVNHAFGV